MGPLLPWLSTMGCVLGLTAGLRAEQAPAPQAALTATAAVATRYVSRGLDISDGPPVPQAGFEYARRDGWYLDGYAAKIRYFGMNAEIDAAVGYRGNRGPLNYDLGFYYYAYPRAAPTLHANYAELGAKLSWSGGRWVPVLELYVSNDYFFGSGKGLFVWSGVDVALPAAISASARIGRVAVEDNRAFIYPDYSTWLLSGTKSGFGLAWTLQLTDTSMTRHDCTDGARCAVKLTVKIARNF
jgi:uncharacterized protein (TIGR02001 family)